MAESKVVTPTSSRLKHTETKKQPPRVPLFYRDNYRWMGIGAAVIVIGMLLMAGVAGIPFSGFGGLSSVIVLISLKL